MILQWGSLGISGLIAGCSPPKGDKGQLGQYYLHYCCYCQPFHYCGILTRGSAVLQNVAIGHYSASVSTSPLMHTASADLINHMTTAEFVKLYRLRTES